MLLNAGRKSAVGARVVQSLGLAVEGLLCSPLRPFFFFVKRPAARPLRRGNGSRDKHLDYALNKLSKGFSLAVLFTAQTLFFFFSWSVWLPGWVATAWVGAFSALWPPFLAFDVVLLFVRESH